MIVPPAQVRNHLLQVCEALLDERVEGVVAAGDSSGGSSSSARVVEVVTGIVANVCAHDGLSARVAGSLLPGLVLRLLWAADVACVCEMCRVVSVALRMQVRGRRA